MENEVVRMIGVTRMDGIELSLTLLVILSV